MFDIYLFFKKGKKILISLTRGILYSENLLHIKRIKLHLYIHISCLVDTCSIDVMAVIDRAFNTWVMKITD